MNVRLVHIRHTIEISKLLPPISSCDSKYESGNATLFLEEPSRLDKYD
jgi:hypothetical protein